MPNFSFFSLAYCFSFCLTCEFEYRIFSISLSTSDIFTRSMSGFSLKFCCRMYLVGCVMPD